MRLRKLMHNFMRRTVIHCVKYAYIYAPVVGLIIYGILIIVIKFDFDRDFKSNLINVSGILAGFLFTSLGIIIALPENKFTNLLKRIGYIQIIYNSMIIGVISLLTSMLMGLFGISEMLSKITFIIGISETFISAYYMYRVSYYSGKSK